MKDLVERQAVLDLIHENWYASNEFYLKQIEGLPTIEAIPIEWIICKRNEHNNDGFAWIFEAVLEDWRKEHDTAD